MRDLWKRLGVREDEDVKVVLNRASRRREIQPDLARKVVGETMVHTTIPADFNALEAAVNTGSPSRLEDNKLRGAFEALATSSTIVPQPEELGRRDDEPRGLLARLGGERGQSTAEFMGLFPVLLLVFLGALADRAHRLHVHHRRPRRPRGGARARDRPDLAKTDEEWREARSATGPRSPRTTRSRARTCRAPGASTPRSSCAATSRSRCGCSVPLLIPA